MSFSADFSGATYVAPTFRSTGKTFAQLQAAGLVGLLEAVVAAQVAITAPASAPTGVAGGSDGSLVAGDYLARITYTNGYGETTASTESSAVTVTSAQHITWTVPALPSGVSGINLYMTAADGLTGTETLYKTGIVATTYSATKLAFAGRATPPTTNTTLLQGRPLSLLRAVEQRQLFEAFETASNQLTAYLRGDPIAFDEIRRNLLEVEAVYKGMVQLMSEVNTLIHANPGQLTGGTRVFS